MVLLDIWMPVMDGFLPATRTVAVQGDVTLPLVTLLWGDPGGDGVGVEDLAITAVNLGKGASPWP